MSACVPTPVSTAFSTVIGEDTVATYSLSTSTVPPVVTTHVDSFCQNEAVLLDSTVCLKTGTRTRIETLQRTFPSPHCFDSPIFAHLFVLSVFLFCFQLLEFRKIDAVPILPQSQFIRHLRPHSMIAMNPLIRPWYPRPTPTVASPRVSKHSRLRCCLHDPIRDRDPGHHPLSYKHSLQRLLEPF